MKETIVMPTCVIEQNGDFKFLKLNAVNTWYWDHR